VAWRRGRAAIADRRDRHCRVSGGRIIERAQPNDVLTINSGSSSLKFAVYRMGGANALLLSGQMAGIGSETGRFRVEDATGATLVEQQAALPDHDSASSRFLDWLRGHETGRGLCAVGHRVVHGGIRYSRPQAVTPEMEAELEGARQARPGASAA
jgi:acetate kinase